MTGQVLVCMFVVCLLFLISKYIFFCAPLVDVSVSLTLNQLCIGTLPIYLISHLYAAELFVVAGLIFNFRQKPKVYNDV